MLLPDWEIQLEKPCSSEPETGENTDQSDPEALLAEAQQLLQDSNTAEAAEKAVELLQSAGDHAPALNLLGDLYFHGKRIARDLSTALHCYRTSAESGDAFGQYMYAICCEEGCGLPAPDHKEAARYYLLAADQGLPRAQHLFAALCAIGKGIECDKKRAFEYFRKAATQGYHRSECSLGYCYSYGIGVQPDPQQAVMWYRRAVEHGNIRAMKNLAACYAEGHGVSADPVMAEKYRKMAEEAELAEMKKKALQQQAANRNGNF